MVEVFSSEIGFMRQVERQYEMSDALTEAVKQGNLSLAYHLIGNYAPGSQNQVRNHNPLRNAQNYCIILNTQLRHGLQQCGIHPYKLDRLSNQIGIQIEQLQEVSKIKEFFDYVLRQYCRLAQEHAYPNLSPLINLAVIYIKEHLSDNLSVQETAKALTVNANYLSTRFHRELGITFIDFLNRERAQQAASLLTQTNLQIQQISQLIGYNHTSYFAKQFARFMGCSPRQYRIEHRTGMA